MKVFFTKLLVPLFIINFCFTTYFILSNNESNMQRSFMFIISICIGGFVLNKLKHNIEILLFLIAAFLFEFIFHFVYDWSNGFKGIVFYIVNFFMVLGYSILCYFLFKKLKKNKDHIKASKVSTIIILILGVISVFLLVKKLDYENLLIGRFIIDSLYKITIVILFCSSLIYFLNNTSKEALALFLLCLSTTVSELLQIAYYSIVENYSVANRENQLFDLFYAMYILKLMGFCFCFYYILLSAKGTNYSKLNFLN